MASLSATLMLHVLALIRGSSASGQSHLNSVLTAATPTTPFPGVGLHQEQHHPGPNECSRAEPSKWHVDSGCSDDPISGGETTSGAAPTGGCATWNALHKWRCTKDSGPLAGPSSGGHPEGPGHYLEEHIGIVPEVLRVCSQTLG